MSLSTDILFASRIGSMLEGFERKSSEKWVFRCPHCGDSATDKHKRRGAFIVIDGNLGFKCKNCGVGNSIGGFLKIWDEGLYGEYVLEKYQESGDSWSSFVKRQEQKKKALEWALSRDASIPETASLADILATPPGPKPSDDDWMSSFASSATPLGEMQRIADLPSTHPGRQYLAGRKIVPGVKGFDDLLWCDDFKLWAHVHCDKEAPREGWKDPRVVAPLISPHGVEIGAQGRSIKPDSKLKYVTAMLDKKLIACYGGHFIDFSKDIWVTEGVYDSLAFDNGLAGLHSDLAGFARAYGLKRESTVLVFDNEPGNRQVREKVWEAVKDGWRIAFWNQPQMVVGKDAASAIVECGRSRENLFTIATGLFAEIEFARWSGGLK